MRPTILLLLVGMTLSPVARADDCSNASDQATMSECAGKALQKSDAELNATYDQIRQRLKNAPETLKLLVGAQRAWIAFRDAECDFSTSPSAGGTIHPMIYTICADRMTRRRVDDLKAYLRCQTNLDCPRAAWLERGADHWHGPA